MTEQNWLTSQDPTAMLRFLQRTQGVTDDPFGNCPIHISNRKFRLFLCACVRELWKRDLVEPDEKVEKCIVVAERFADGKASKKELNRAYLYIDLESSHFPGWILAYFATLMDLDTIWSQGYTTDPFLHPPTQAALLREIVGNPFRSLSPTQTCLECGGVGEVGPCGLTNYYKKCPVCNGQKKLFIILPDPTLHMARTIYEERDWEALPLLADMMEDAGCDCQELLHHFRDQVLCPACSQGDPIEKWYGGGGGWCAYCDKSGPDLHWIPSDQLLPEHKHLHSFHCRGCAFLDTLLGLS